jgi:hypothetical protein
MPISGFWKRAGLACATLLLCLLLAATATASKKVVQLRVLTSSGKTLADVHQRTGTTKIRASKKADCFGQDNPSSHKRYRLEGATALGVVKDAMASHERLRPLLVNDAFVADGFGLGVCSIGGFATVDFSYWYLAVNHVAASTGPDLIPLHNHDRVLWYLTSGSESGFPNELVLKAPDRVKPGNPFGVRVFSFAGDGTRTPAAGVMVPGATGPTDANGRTTEGGAPEGILRLKATGGPDDVPSAVEKVCVNADASQCPGQ